MEASEPKWVNPVLDNFEVNSLRLRGLQMYFSAVTVELNKIQMVLKIISEV